MCGGAASVEKLPAEARFERGMAFYDDGKYERAIEEFRFVTFNAPGSEYGDDAQLYLAECHFALREYILAVSEYERLQRMQPDSPLLPEAAFKRAESYRMLSPKYSLDQEYTHKSIEAYQEFIEDYPDSERREEAQRNIDKARFKLARKQFENGRLYKKMGVCASAIIYLEQLLDLYYDSRYAAPGRWLIAECHVELDQIEEAVRVLRTIIERNDSAEYVKKARHKLSELSALKAAERADKSGLSQASEPD